MRCQHLAQPPGWRLRYKEVPVVLYGCETWSLTLREERRLMVFENRVLTKIFETQRDEVTGSGENYIMRSLIISTPQIKEMGGACSTY
jgi:hypothetical protein